MVYEGYLQGERVMEIVYVVKILKAFNDKTVFVP